MTGEQTQTQRVLENPPLQLVIRVWTITCCLPTSELSGLSNPSGPDSTAHAKVLDCRPCLPRSASGVTGSSRSDASQHTTVKTLKWRRGGSGNTYLGKSPQSRHIISTARIDCWVMEHFTGNVSGTPWQCVCVLVLSTHDVVTDLYCRSLWNLSPAGAQVFEYSLIMYEQSVITLVAALWLGRGFNLLI